MITETQNIIEKAQEIYNKGLREVYFICNDGTKEKRRIGKTGGGEIIVMVKGSKRRGFYLDHTDYKDILEIKHNVTDKDKWERQIKKGIALLNDSGLWPDIKRNFEVSLSIGYDKIREAYKVINSDYDEDYNKTIEIRTQKVKEIDERLIKEGSYDTGILWSLVSIPKIKKMNFGKYLNEDKLKEIAEALKNKQKIHVEGSNGYDISFDYDPQQNRAWYSEEYKNCGNGHYYLALNKEYAFFEEDD